ncbi:MAG: alpha/beta fold hydrolase [Gemmatimonadaceae bacterium]
MTISARPGHAGQTSHRVRVGDVELFYLDASGGSPPLVLLHGLSSNANAFGGLLSAGLSPTFRVIAPDLRGRARSSKPASGYGMGAHAADIIGLLDALGLDRVVLGGHSFGGYLAMFIAAHYPERVERLIVIDAAITSHPRIGVLLKPSLDRLTRVAPSADDYIAEIRAAAYLEGAWDDDVEQYFRAEIIENPDGTAQASTSASAVAQAIAGIAYEPWLHIVQHVRHPTLFLSALGAYGPPGTPPLIDEITARATARAFPNATYVLVPGNHITMVFGEAAAVVRREVERFVFGSVRA